MRMADQTTLTTLTVHQPIRVTGRRTPRLVRSLLRARVAAGGLGVPPTVPTWGGMVAAGRDQIITGNWWIYVFPGLAIMLTVLAINAVGDWLRDYLDPRLRV